MSLLFGLTNFILTLVVIKTISLNFDNYPINPKIGDFVTFSTIILPNSESKNDSSLIKYLENTTFLWYYKSFSYDEFALIGTGKILILEANSFFDGIYNLTLIFNNNSKIISYSRPVIMKSQFGIDISINNQSFRSSFKNKYPIFGKKFNFRCRVMGNPRYFSLIFPANAKCNKQYVEEIPRIHMTDFVFENCEIVLSGRYGCRIANVSRKFIKTFKIHSAMEY